MDVEDTQRTTEIERLPTELLVAIFQHLRMTDLAQVRQTCYHWYEIVSSHRMLMSRFVLSLRNCRVYEGCEQCRAMTRTKSVYEKISLKCCTVDAAPTFWRAVGDNVVELTLNDCTLSAEVLFNLLRHTRNNLRTLTLKSTKFDDHSIRNVTVDYRLERLHSLTLRSTFVYDEFFYVFKQICPGLKALKLTFSSFENWGQQLVEFVQTLSHTLDAITLSYTKVNNVLLQCIANVRNLKLRKVSLKACYELKQRDILELIRVQPTIVHLNLDSLFSAEDPFLRALSSALPQLKRIKLRIARTSSLQQAFLGNLPHLNYLKLTDSTHIKGNLDLSSYENVALEKLYVSSANFRRNTLPRFFERCPNIRSLTLYQCTYENIHDLQLGFSQLNGLEYLNLQRTFDIGDSFFNRAVFDTVVMPFERVRFFAITNLSKLCYINLSHCRDLSDQTLLSLSFPLLKKIDLRGLHITDAGIESLVRECPRLEYVHVDACKRICDNAVLYLCRDLRQLKLLNLESCKGITDVSVQHIRQHCRSLVWLSVMNCPLLSEDAKGTLSRMRTLRSIYV